MLCADKLRVFDSFIEEVKVLVKKNINRVVGAANIILHFTVGVEIQVFIFIESLEQVISLFSNW